LVRWNEDEFRRHSGLRWLREPGMAPELPPRKAEYYTRRLVLATISLIYEDSHTTRG
jgi:hypothetical protein